MSGVMAAYTAGLVLLTAGLLLAARVAYVRLSRFDAEHELTTADNPAVGTSLFGFLAGVVIVLASLLGSESLADPNEPAELAWDLVEVALYGLVSIVLLKLSGWINDKVILLGFENRKELVDDRNVGAGAVLCGTYIASGLVLAGAFAGRIDPSVLPPDLGRGEVFLRELGTAVAFFALGQVVLALYGFVYSKLSKVNVHKAIEGDYVKDGVKHGGNLAAGLAFGGHLVAIGLLLWSGARHDFVNWPQNLTWFGVAAGVGVVALPVWRLFVDHVLMGKADLAREIYEDRNVNAALLETSALLGLAVALALVL